VREAGWRTGELHGGPLAGTGTLTCAIHVNAPTHAGTPRQQRSEVGANIVVIWPTAVSFPAAPSDDVTVCTSFTGTDGRRLYRDGSTGQWTYDANVPCDDAITGHEDIQRGLTAVVRQADAVACPLLAALPASPARDVVDVSPAGDVTAAGRQVHDCPPYDHAGPVPYLGDLTALDTGTGVVWSVTGELADPNHWYCYDSSSVYPATTCDYVGGGIPPTCDRASALATALPTLSASTTWGTADTYAVCEGDLIAELVDSGEANASAHTAYAERAMVRQHLTRVHCSVHDGSGGAPAPSYLADCQFTF
jgi:hypothetical protein